MKVKHKKFERQIYFDTETVFQKSEPIEPTIIRRLVNNEEKEFKYKRVNVIAYAVGWVRVDVFWRKDLLDNLTKPLQVDNKKNRIYVEFGKHAIKKFIEYLDNYSSKYDLVVYVHNANFDIPFLSAARDEHFGKENITIEEKRAKKTCVVCKWVIKKPGEANRNIEFRDTYLFERMSLRRCISSFLDENGEKMNKESIEYEKYDMKFNNDGSPLGYYINKPIKIGRDAKNNILTLYKKHWVDWKDVEDKERSYLISDVKGLPLLEISQVRLKKTAYLTVKNFCCLPDVGKKEYRLLLLSPTKGSYGKKLCSYIQAHEYADDEQMKRWAKYHKNNWFDALLKHKYKGRGEYDLDVRSMFGGFTSLGAEDWWDAKEGEWGYVVDVNSLYPFIMCQGLPVGDVLHEKPEGTEGVDYVKQYIFKPKYRTKKNNANKNQGILPVWLPKYPFRTNVLGDSFFKKFEHIKGSNGVDDEFAIWADYYDGVIKKMCLSDFEFVRYRYQLFKNPLAKFMYAMQTIKQENSHRIEGSGSIEEMKYNAAKILSNAMYGKSMEKRHEDTEYFHNQLRVYMREEEYKSTGEKVIEQPYFTGNTGSYVCSMARKTIMLAMKSIIDAGGKVFYCDTDSIMFTLKGDLPNQIPIDAKELGKFKVERIFNSFRSMGKCKKYHVSLRNLNIPDEQLIEWIKNNHPNWVWQHLEGKDLQHWKELIKPKVTAAGFDKKTISKLPLEIIDKLYNPNTNVLVVKCRNFAYEDQLTKVTAIEKVDSSFNTLSKSEDHYGNPIERGRSDYTGVLYPVENNGVIEMVYKDINELPLFEIDELNNPELHYG